MVKLEVCNVTVFIDYSSKKTSNLDLTLGTAGFVTKISKRKLFKMQKHIIRNARKSFTKQDSNHRLSVMQFRR